ncbi:Estrogen sulfotransferase [Chionoecetes opilio]|uniref:Estrogen sulfotransferase n=1 Tax=Chionoecetes opilio TaxID=41210 RepID=A0A8J4XXA8_CHIOP|nr:Estrogen sulfotransferase [Chionoecetes opilio]
MLLDSSHKATLLEEEELAQQEKDFTGYKHGLVRLNPGRWLFPAEFTKFANGLFNFKWRNSDVVVMTYPKCGTNWTQEIIWTMRNNANFDHPLAMDPLMDRSPFFECDMFFAEEVVPGSSEMNECPSFQRLCPGADPKDGMYLQISEATPDPRTIKTHLPFSLLHHSMLDTAKVT